MTIVADVIGAGGGRGGTVFFYFIFYRKYYHHYYCANYFPVGRIDGVAIVRYNKVKMATEIRVLDLFFFHNFYRKCNNDSSSDHLPIEGIDTG